MKLFLQSITVIMLSLAVVAGVRQGEAPQQVVKKDDELTFGRLTYADKRGNKMPYRLFVPPNYNSRQKYPLILWLHGGAGRGSDNVLQISGGNEPGTHVWAKPENQAKLPAFVMAPQCPEEQYWADRDTGSMNLPLRLAVETLDAVEKEYSIDLDRVYVAGQSMGGIGTWAVIRHEPGRFAAALVLCAFDKFTNAKGITRVPVWVFQGDTDSVVSVDLVRQMANELKKSGVQLRYSEYHGVGHQVWEKAFTEPDLVPWLAAQKRGPSILAPR